MWAFPASVQYSAVTGTSIAMEPVSYKSLIDRLQTLKILKKELPIIAHLGNESIWTKQLNCDKLNCSFCPIKSKLRP